MSWHKNQVRTSLGKMHQSSDFDIKDKKLRGITKTRQLCYKGTPIHKYIKEHTYKSRHQEKHVVEQKRNRRTPTHCSAHEEHPSAPRAVGGEAK